MQRTYDKGEDSSPCRGVLRDRFPSPCDPGVPGSHEAWGEKPLRGRMADWEPSRTCIHAGDSQPSVQKRKLGLGPLRPPLRRSLEPRPRDPVGDLGVIM